MRKTVNVHEAKTHLSRLLQDVESGREVVIARAGRPVAKLVPVTQVSRRVLGRERGEIWIANDFDKPMTDEWLDEWER